MRKVLSVLLTLSIISTFIFPVPPAESRTLAGLPEPGIMVHLSPTYAPVMIKGVTVNKHDPFAFDFIVDIGQDKLQGEELKAESEKLIKYFLAALAIPEQDLWVNLSPYEKDRIIPESLGQTDMGRDLLAQDYILKQLTASVVYPEQALGKKFWDRVAQQAQEKFGTTKIPVNTFHKVWITADKAEVFEQGQTAFAVNCHLKVMLEEDYLAYRHAGLAQSHQTSHPEQSSHPEGAHATEGSQKLDSSSLKNTPQNDASNITNQIMRQIVIPAIEHEVNFGQNFAMLRQISNSIILASWYKKNLKQALINEVYSDKAKINGIQSSVHASIGNPEQIYQRYLTAYKKGVFNVIREAPDASGQMTPKKYFSGGFGVGAMANPSRTNDRAMVNEALPKGRTVVIKAGLNPTPKSKALNPGQTLTMHGIKIETKRMLRVIDQMADVIQGNGNFRRANRYLAASFLKGEDDRQVFDVLQREFNQPEYQWDLQRSDTLIEQGDGMTPRTEWTIDVAHVQEVKDWLDKTSQQLSAGLNQPSTQAANDRAMSGNREDVLNAPLNGKYKFFAQALRQAIRKMIQEEETSEDFLSIARIARTIKVKDSAKPISSSALSYFIHGDYLPHFGIVQAMVKRFGNDQGLMKAYLKDSLGVSKGFGCFVILRATVLQMSFKDLVKTSRVNSTAIYSLLKKGTILENQLIALSNALRVNPDEFKDLHDHFQERFPQLALDKVNPDDVVDNFIPLNAQWDKNFIPKRAEAMLRESQKKEIDLFLEGIKAVQLRNDQRSELRTALALLIVKIDKKVAPRKPAKRANPSISRQEMKIDDESLRLNTPQVKRFIHSILNYFNASMKFNVSRIDANDNPYWQIPWTSRYDFVAYLRDRLKELKAMDSAMSTEQGPYTLRNITLAFTDIIMATDLSERMPRFDIKTPGTPLWKFRKWAAESDITAYPLAYTRGYIARMAAKYIASQRRYRDSWVEEKYPSKIVRFYDVDGKAIFNSYKQPVMPDRKTPIILGGSGWSDHDSGKGIKDRNEALREGKAINDALQAIGMPQPVLYIYQHSYGDRENNFLRLDHAYVLAARQGMYSEEAWSFAQGVLFKDITDAHGGKLSLTDLKKNLRRNWVVQSYGGTFAHMVINALVEQMRRMTYSEQEIAQSVRQIFIFAMSPAMPMLIEEGNPSPTILVVEDIKDYLLFQSSRKGIHPIGQNPAWRYKDNPFLLHLSAGRFFVWMDNTFEQTWPGQEQPSPWYGIHDVRLTAANLSDSVKKVLQDVFNAEAIPSDEKILETLHADSAMTASKVQSVLTILSLIINNYELAEHSHSGDLRVYKEERERAYLQYIQFDGVIDYLNRVADIINRSRFRRDRRESVRQQLGIKDQERGMFDLLWEHVRTLSMEDLAKANDPYVRMTMAPMMLNLVKIAAISNMGDSAMNAEDRSVFSNGAVFPADDVMVTFKSLVELQPEYPDGMVVIDYSKTANREDIVQALVDTLNTKASSSGKITHEGKKISWAVQTPEGYEGLDPVKNPEVKRTVMKFYNEIGALRTLLLTSPNYSEVQKADVQDIGQTMVTIWSENMDYVINWYKQGFATQDLVLDIFMRRLAGKNFKDTAQNRQAARDFVVRQLKDVSVDAAMTVRPKTQSEKDDKTNELLRNMLLEIDNMADLTKEQKNEVVRVLNDMRGSFTMFFSNGASLYTVNLQVNRLLKTTNPALSQPLRTKLKNKLNEQLSLHHSSAQAMDTSEPAIPARSPVKVKPPVDKVQEQVQEQVQEPVQVNEANTQAILPDLTVMLHEVVYISKKMMEFNTSKASGGYAEQMVRYLEGTQIVDATIQDMIAELSLALLLKLGWTHDYKNLTKFSLSDFKDPVLDELVKMVGFKTVGQYFVALQKDGVVKKINLNSGILQIELPESAGPFDQLISNRIDSVLVRNFSFLRGLSRELHYFPNSDLMTVLDNVFQSRNITPDIRSVMGILKPQLPEVSSKQIKTLSVMDEHRTYVRRYPYAVKIPGTSLWPVWYFEYLIRKNNLPIKIVLKLNRIRNEMDMTFQYAPNSSSKLFEEAIVEFNKVFAKDWDRFEQKDDSAQTTTGGIDLNIAGADLMVRKSDGGVQMHIDAAMIERIRREGIDGLLPVIYSITPIADASVLIR